MVREVDLVSYLPQFVADYREIRTALEAENPEFVLVWRAAERVLKNEFITTADEYGISRFEKILHIFPDKKETLEERKAKLIMKYNLRLPYTLFFLEELIASIVGEENYTVECKFDQYQLKINILNHDTRYTKNIYTAVNPLIPCNMTLLLYAEYRETVKAEIKQAATITFITAFYPRMNIPKLFLDGTWKLDGTRKLSGYDGYGKLDFYPVGVRFQAGGRGTPQEKPRYRIVAGAREGPEAGSAVSVRIQAECKAAETERVRIQASAEAGAGTGDIQVYNRNQLDGIWRLDGRRKLNGGVSVL